MSASTENPQMCCTREATLTTNSYSLLIQFQRANGLEEDDKTFWNHFLRQSQDKGYQQKLKPTIAYGQPKSQRETPSSSTSAKSLGKKKHLLSTISIACLRSLLYSTFVRFIFPMITWLRSFPSNRTQFSLCLNLIGTETWRKWSTQK